MGIRLNLETDAIKEAISEAILNELGDEGRREVIAQAIAYLTKEQRRDYGIYRSPLQNAFDVAVADLARTLVADYIKNDPATKAKIEEVIAETAQRMIASDRSIREAIAKVTVSQMWESASKADDTN